jgi:hypothetical protein
VSLVLLLVVVVGLLLSPLLATDSRDGHDWTPHYLFPHPGSGDGGGDYWSEKSGMRLDHVRPRSPRRHRVPGG